MYSCLIRLLTFLILYSSAAVSAADFFDPIQSLSRTRHWQLLLHMDIGPSKWSSRVDSPEFFFSKAGKKDPDAELKSTIHYFQMPYKGDPNKHPLCRFPARRKFIEKKLNLKFTNVRCPDFEEWKRGINPVGVTLVFASAYPGNVASMFGHTFLRFSRASKRNDLLDYGANFGATIDPEDNAIVYSFKGIFGGYRGNFSVSSYYQKVNEYAQLESRDVWEYELKLSKEQVEMIVSHLWELYYNSWFDYWFIDENCSYVLAALINVANPDWKLVDSRKWFVMPHDIVKKVSIQIPLRSIKFRPGVKKVLEERLEHLDSEQRDKFESLIEGKNVKSLKTETLDAGLDYFNYKKMKQKGQLSKNENKLYQKLLVARSKRSDRGNLILVPTKNRPDDAHQSSLLGMTVSHDKDKFSYFFTNEQVFKDWVDADKGYEPFSRFKAFGFTVKASELRIEFENLNFISATSHTPWNTIDASVSWEVNSGYRRVWDNRCDNCFPLELEGKVGLSFMSTHNSLFTILVGGFGQAHGDLPDGHGAGWVATSRLGHAANDKLKFFIEGNIKSDQANKNSDWYLDSTAGLTVSVEKVGDIQLKSVVRKIKEGPEKIMHQLALNFFY
jgi:hypothetical protein